MTEENNDCEINKDSISFGSSAKGVMLKCYVNFDTEDTSIITRKVDNMLKTRLYLADKGIKTE